jgi:hypothetical protein
MMHNDKRAVGQLLVAGEVINAQDLEFALEHQKYSKEPLGRILIRMGAVTENDLDTFMMHQSI